MVTLSVLRNLNIAWSDDDFIDVNVMEDFISSGAYEPEHLKVRFALVLYGNHLVRRFNGNSIWID